MFYWRNQFLISDINVANKAYDLWEQVSYYSLSRGEQKVHSAEKAVRWAEITRWFPSWNNFACRYLYTQHALEIAAIAYLTSVLQAPRQWCSTSNVNHTDHTIIMAAHFHFGYFRFCFDASLITNKYKLRTSCHFCPLSEQLLKDGMVTFKGYGWCNALPSTILIQAHAAMPLLIWMTLT